MAKTSEVDFGVVRIELEITINASPDSVWDALVNKTSNWWLNDFLTNPDAKGFVIEPKIGGHAFEDWGNGEGQVWYQVVGVQAPRMLMLNGFLTAEYGGPANTQLQLTLLPHGQQTTLQVSDTIFGRVGSDKLQQTREGWRMLFEDGLKGFVE